MGLDIGTRSLVVAVLSDGGRPRLLDLIERELLPTDDPGERRAEITRAINEVFEEEGLPRDRVVVAVPAQQTVFRELAVPFTDKAKVRSTIPSVAEGQLPFPIEDVILDHQTVGESEEETKVLAAAVRKSVLRDFFEILSSCEIDPVAVDLDVAALCNAAALAEALSPDGVTLVVDLGASATKVALLEGGRLRAIRAFRTGGDSVNAAIQQKMGVRFEEAEARKTGVRELRADQAYDGDPLTQSVAEGLEKVAREVKRFVASVDPDLEVETAWLAGGASRAPGADTFLASRLGVDVQNLDVLAALRHRLPDPEAERLRPVAPVAVGLGLRGLRKGEVSYNFRQQEFRPRTALDQLKVPLAWCLAFALLLVCVLAYDASIELVSARNEYNAFKKRQDEVWEKVMGPGKRKPPGPIVNLLNSELGSLTKKRKNLPERSGESALDVLLEISERTRNVSFEIDSLKATQNMARIRGLVGSVGEAETIQREINASASLAAAAPTTKIYPDGSFQFFLEIKRKDEKDGNRSR